MSKHEIENVILDLLQKQKETQSAEVFRELASSYALDEFAIREAIWSLLSKHRVDLTSDRRLRISVEKGTDLAITG